MRRLSLLMILAAGWLCAGAAEPQSVLVKPVFESDRAMKHVHHLMLWVPRSIGTPGHRRALEYIDGVLRSYPDMVVTRQVWTETGSDGKMLTLTNLVGRLHEKSGVRLLLGTHYDSIVRAYRDPDPALRNAPMPGANNSASGVAVLLEVARVLSAKASEPIGVDFVFFDGEEGPLALGAGDPNWRALGSPYFVKHISEFYPANLPKVAVVYDMVCKKELRLTPESSSMNSAPDELDFMWRIGGQVARGMFVNEPGGPIGDDHVPLAKIGIPSILLIDFNYEPWFNTSHDTEDKCDPVSLKGVGDTSIIFSQEVLRDR